MQNCGVVVIVTVVVPSLHHRKEGWPRDQENIAKPPLIARTGWFSLITNGKPPRLRQRRWLRDIFLMTQPPLLAVMQGGDYNYRSCKFSSLALEVRRTVSLCKAFCA